MSHRARPCATCIVAQNSLFGRMLPKTFQKNRKGKANSFWRLSSFFHSFFLSYQNISYTNLYFMKELKRKDRERMDGRNFLYIWPLYFFEQKQRHSNIHSARNTKIIKLFRSAHQKFFWKDKLLLLLKVKHYSISCMRATRFENFVLSLYLKCDQTGQLSFF